MIRVTKKLLFILSRKQKGELLILGLLMLIGGALESFGIALILPLIETIEEPEGWDKGFLVGALSKLGVDNFSLYTKVLILILIFVYIFKSCFLLFEYYVQNSYVARGRLDMQKRLLRAFLNKPYEYFLNASTGEIIRIISSDSNQAFNLLNSTMFFYTELIVCFIVGATIVYISPIISVYVLFVLTFEVLIISAWVKPYLKKVGEEFRLEGAKANKWMLQAISGIKSIKVANCSDYFTSNYELHASKTANSERINQTIMNVPRLIIESVTISSVLLMLLISMMNEIDARSLMPQLSAFVVAAVRLLPSANRISTALNQVSYYEGGLDNVIAVINGGMFTDNSKAISHSDTKTLEKLEPQKNISFNHITYRYPNSSEDLFFDCSFDIKIGQSIGIIGKSGAGKTTTVDILLGLLHPQNGAVLVDGIDIASNEKAWLKNTAYIPQNIFLIDDTIKENVVFGNTNNYTDEDVWKALDEAQIGTFVRGLPNGMMTEVGDSGVRLSGGQRQRIGIARALFSGAKILVFDEATSALDGDTENAIIEAIESLKGKCTVIIIAHRLSTIRHCDIVYSVNNKTITKVNNIVGVSEG